MKKIKLLPLLFALPMLTSCGGLKISAPRFAKEGNEISYKKILEKVGKFAERCDFAKESALSGGIYKSTSGSTNTVEVFRNGKSFRKGSVNILEKEEAQYDKDNAIIKSKSEYRFP